MKVEMYFLLLVILTATVMNCGQGKKKQIDFYSRNQHCPSAPSIASQKPREARIIRVKQAIVPSSNIDVGHRQIWSLSEIGPLFSFPFRPFFSCRLF